MLKVNYIFIIGLLLGNLNNFQKGRLIATARKVSKRNLIVENRMLKLSLPLVRCRGRKYVF